MRDAFSVMSFNIDGASSSRPRRYQWHARREAVAEVALANSNDVLCFQEAQPGNLSSLRATLAGHDEHLGPASVEQLPAENATFNLIYWSRDRFERIRSGGFYLSASPAIWSLGWDARHVRCATWVHLRSRRSGAEVIVFNAHLDSIGRLARIGSADLIINMLAKMAAESDAAIIIAGDFNSRAWAPPDETRLSYPRPVLPEFLPEAGPVHQRFMDSGFDDAFLAAGNNDRLDTNTYHDFYGDAFPPVALRIDWLLFRSRYSNLQLRTFDVVRGKMSGVYPSDHYPICASFELFPEE